MHFLSSDYCSTTAHSCTNTANIASACATLNPPVLPPLWLGQAHCRMGEVEPGGTCTSSGQWKDPLCWTAHPVEMRGGITWCIILSLILRSFCTAYLSLQVQQVGNMTVPVLYTRLEMADGNPFLSPSFGTRTCATSPMCTLWLLSSCIVLVYNLRCR